MSRCHLSYDEWARLGELKALVAVLHLAVAVGAELEAWCAQSRGSAVESLVDGD